VVDLVAQVAAEVAARMESTKMIHGKNRTDANKAVEAS
jgi:hypothetical protein